MRMQTICSCESKVKIMTPTCKVRCPETTEELNRLGAGGRDQTAVESRTSREGDGRTAEICLARSSRQREGDAAGSAKIASTRMEEIASRTGTVTGCRAQHCSETHRRHAQVQGGGINFDVTSTDNGTEQTIQTVAQQALVSGSLVERCQHDPNMFCHPTFVVATGSIVEGHHRTRGSRKQSVGNAKSGFTRCSRQAEGNCTSERNAYNRGLPIGTTTLDCSQQV